MGMGLRNVTFDRRAIHAVVALCLLCPSALNAQSAPEAGTAKAVLRQFVANRLNTDPASAQALIEELSKGIVIGISQAPTGASSAGFTYNFDPQTGERTLKSQSFGPQFVDRPLTNGRGVVSFGIAASRANYSKFQGEDLDSRGILMFDNRVRFRDNNQEQFISEFVSVSPKVTTVNATLGYGVTSSLDLGVTVPLVSMDFTARRYWNYDVSRSFATDPTVRTQFPLGPVGQDFESPLTAPNTGSASATGLGDITLRAKYAFGGQGIAAVADVKLPTGNEDNLIGTGKASTRFGLVASRPLSDAVSVTVNGSYRVGGLTDEANYAVALDAALLSTKKLTTSLEFVGHYLTEGINEIGSRVVASQGNPQATLTNTVPVFSLGGVNLLYGAVGAKYNVGKSALLTAGVLVPFGDRGLQSSYTILVGLDVVASARR